MRLGFSQEVTASPVDWVSAEIEKGKSLDEVIGQIEKEILMRVLTETAGNQSQAAAKLGLKRGTLQYKMKQYNLG